MLDILEKINSIVWGLPSVVLILFVGIALSIRTGFAQLRLFPDAVRKLIHDLNGGSEEESVTPVQALCTALAATAGTGNLVGVAGAIALGGPGSIFWMWICGIFGMMIKFAEATLAVRYRVERDGETVAGPMYMILGGLPVRWKPMAYVYAVLGLCASFGIGNATQINAVVTAAEQAAMYYGVPLSVSARLMLGVVLGVIVGLVLTGGAKRIGSTAELLVPLISASYLALCVLVLWRQRAAIPAVVASVFTGAFSPRAVTGGIVGSVFQTLRVGMSRGVFTNEAGLGTASMAHGGAAVYHPAQQGLMGILEVFLDTIVICTMTALVILSSGVPIGYGTDCGAVLTVQAFSAVCGDWIAVFLAVSLGLFAFATILGWGLYGARCAQFLFGSGRIRYLALAQAVMVVVGAVMKTEIIWSLSEVFNGLMAIPNLIALIGLGDRFCELSSEFEKKRGEKAAGGTYENFNQCKSLPALSHAEIPSLRTGSQETG